MSEAVTDTETIAVHRSNGVVEDWRFTYTQSESANCVIDALSPSGLTYSAPADDFFAALQGVRRQMDTAGLLPLCAGARIDAYPSGMMRGMNSGLTVYLLRRHFQATRLAYLFDPAPAEKVGTVSAQEEYFERWAASLKLPAGYSAVRGQLWNWRSAFQDRKVFRTAWTKEDARRSLEKALREQGDDEGPTP